MDDYASHLSRSKSYQNSLIAQLVQQQKEYRESLKNKGSSKQTCTEVSPTNSMIRSRLNILHREISDLDKRMENIQFVKGEKCTYQNTKDLVSSESEPEHIYETIPEIDSDIEPIYASPYEPPQECPKDQPNWNVSSVDKIKETQQKLSRRSKSSKSNSSVEDHENTSSAYNSGGSSNSNALTVELTPVEKHQKKASRSSVIFLRPITYLTDTSKMFPRNCDNCKLEMVSVKPKKTKAQSSKVVSPSNSYLWPSVAASHMLTDTVYTNVANLEQTMLLQQQIFRQALAHQKKSMNVPHATTATAPSLAKLQFSNTQQQVCKIQNDNSVPEIKMEWKVKRRSDGTRYVARRPVRNRFLRNRAIHISEERASLSTDDDTISELKFQKGKFWNKDHRKNVTQSKEKTTKQELVSFNGAVENPQPSTQKQLCKINSTRKTVSHSDGFIKKHKSKRSSKEGVRDIAVQVPPQRNKDTSNSNTKTGLLSVTIV